MDIVDTFTSQHKDEGLIWTAGNSQLLSFSERLRGLLQFLSPLQKCLSLFANFFLLSWNVSETESLNNNSPEPLANAKLAGPLDNANPAGPLDNAIDFVAPPSLLTAPENVPTTSFSGRWNLGCLLAGLVALKWLCRQCTICQIWSWTCASLSIAYTPS